MCRRETPRRSVARPNSRPPNERTPRRTRRPPPKNSPQVDPRPSVDRTSLRECTASWRRSGAAFCTDAWSWSVGSKSSPELAWCESMATPKQSGGPVELQADVRSSHGTHLRHANVRAGSDYVARTEAAYVGLRSSIGYIVLPTVVAFPGTV